MLGSDSTYSTSQVYRNNTKETMRCLKTMDPVDKPFVCKLCGKTFAYRRNLNSHTRTHTGKKPYECQYCDQAFSWRCNLTSHTRVHTGEKPYQCEYCGKAFSHGSSLTRHMRCCSEDERHKNSLKYVREHVGGTSKDDKPLIGYARFVDKDLQKVPD